MREICIQISGQKIRLEIDQKKDAFCNLKDAVSGFIVKDRLSIDGVLKILPVRAHRTIFIGKGAKGLLKLDFLISWRDQKKGILNGIYSDGWKASSEPARRRIEVTLEAIKLFSFKCATYTKSLILHASGIKKDGQGRLFIGKSGSGKSTLCRLSKEGDVIHDDLNALRKNHKGWLIFPCPGAKTKSIKPVKLRSIFFIKKSRRNKIQKLSLKESLKELEGQCISLRHSDSAVETYDSLFDLFKKVPSYRLHFRKDPSFWRLIDNL